MINKQNKNQVRLKRHMRVRNKVSGTAECPRLNVYRSTVHIYAQVIDDVAGVTIASSSTVAKDMNVKGKTKTEAAALVGASVAKKAMEKGVQTVVFDRGGYLYTGRVKALADGARDAGLKF
ncbi:MAG: 50S ribosomal protein L18 [Clostridia bacterium]|nr:50S ribosomal protein L18 [Clostridia bacterium]